MICNFILVNLSELKILKDKMNFKKCIFYLGFRDSYWKQTDI